jgi:hypothetical protein
LDALPEVDRLTALFHKLDDAVWFDAAGVEWTSGWQDGRRVKKRRRIDARQYLADGRVR